MTDRYGMPERTRTTAGEPRRVGVEVEFIGPDTETTASILANAIGGEARRVTRYEYSISGDPAGEWRVELDQEILKRLGREREESGEDPDLLDVATEELVSFGTDGLAPVEVVSPPLPLERLPEFDALTEALRSAGALGTNDSLAYAFGLHFNPELPALDAATVTAYLKAFLCLQDWLKENASIDLTRELTFFARPFPTAYARKVVDPDYWPSLDTLIDDYLADNPTRNRSLDMLPLFMELDPERVRRVVEDPRVKSRPTLHYRLPNSEIGRRDWRIADAWNDWLYVERLSNDAELLQDLCGLYHKRLGQPLTGFFRNWANDTDKWLQQNVR